MRPPPALLLGLRSTTECRGASLPQHVFGPSVARGRGRPASASEPSPRRSEGVKGLEATRCVTPRQTCPRPRLRAQLAFKDSMVHGILQFTPSIAFRYVLHRCESRDIRCRESFRLFMTLNSNPSALEPRAAGACPIVVVPWRFARRGLFGAPSAGGGLHPRRPELWATERLDAPRHPGRWKTVRGSFCSAGIDNDPSAGSPTETLLRLLLPLNDKVQWTSRDVVGGEPPTSPRSEHFTGPFNR